jgi:pimeloyl-ACP methyl ester carboxylesterase
MNHFLQFRGKRISYESAGKGNAIVFLHGFIESSKIWSDFISGLQQEFKVIAIDLPGHGDSEVVADIHSMPLMAEVVNAVMTDAGISKAVIVGHSMGGYVSLAFADLYPGKIAGLVLFHSHAAPDSDESKTNRQRTIKIVEQNRAGFIKQFIPDLFDPRYVNNYQDSVKFLIGEAGRMTPSGIIAAIAGMRDRISGLDILEKSAFPFLFIVGKQDSRIPCKLVLEQASIPMHSEILILEKVGHMGYIESRETTYQAIRHFALKGQEVTHLQEPFWRRVQ